MSKSQTITIGWKEIVIEFTGENISHEAWAISIDYYVDKIELLPVLKRKFDEEEKPWKRWPKETFTKWEVIFEMINWYMKWYSTMTEYSKTAYDPIRSEIVDSTIPSQPTFSRHMTWFTTTDENKLKEMNKELIIEYMKYLVEKNGWEKLECIEISDDSTNIPTYWKQEWSEFIAHYWVVWYHPDLITEDDMKLIMAWVLRDWNVYSSQWSHLLIMEVIDLLKVFTKKIIFRWDSAYARPEVLRSLQYDDLEIEYYIKEKTYKSWASRADVTEIFEWKTYQILDLPREYFEVKQKNGNINKQLTSKYFVFYHKVNTWDKEEKIICKLSCIWDEKQLTLWWEMNKNIELLIVKWEKQWAEAFKTYGKRGKQEQLIEEFKNDSFWKNLSGESKISNSCTMMIKIIAHNLMQILRIETLYDTKNKNCRISTMRNLLVRIWWKLVKHARKQTIKLARVFPNQGVFQKVIERIWLFNFTLC